MEILTSTSFARVFRFACTCTLLLSGNSALPLTLAFRGNLNGDGVAIIIAFSIVIVLSLIIYITELANTAVFLKASTSNRTSRDVAALTRGQLISRLLPLEYTASFSRFCLVHPSSRGRWSCLRLVFGARCSS